MVSPMKNRTLWAEIINVGNELLDGRTLNTNLHWLCGQLSQTGYVVRKAVIIRDDIKEIASAVVDSLRRRPKWIFISGGLGPTHDDKTLDGVALAVGRKLTLNRQAVGLLKKRYRHLVSKGIMQKVELTEERLKMARLPSGSKPLRNRAGSAPGVLLEKAGSKLVCLPGVPVELQSIFADELLGRLRAESRGRRFVTSHVKLKGILESTLGPIIEETMRRFPGLYVKSHPRGFVDSESVVDIDLIAERRGRNHVPKRLEEAKRFLLKRVRELKSSQGSRPR